MRVLCHLLPDKYQVFTRIRQGDSSLDAEPSSKGNKKRRREKAKKSKAKESKLEAEVDSDSDVKAKKPRKQMIRIRAKIHCTAAGLPGLDGPAEQQGNDTAGNGVADLPEWHPLEKVGLRASLLWLV